MPRVRIGERTARGAARRVPPRSRRRRSHRPHRAGSRGGRPISTKISGGRHPQAMPRRAKILGSGFDEERASQFRHRAPGSRGPQGAAAQRDLRRVRVRLDDPRGRPGEPVTLPLFPRRRSSGCGSGPSTARPEVSRSAQTERRSCPYSRCGPSSVRSARSLASPSAGSSATKADVAATTFQPSAKRGLHLAADQPQRRGAARVRAVAKSRPKVGDHRFR